MKTNSKRISKASLVFIPVYLLLQLFYVIGSLPFLILKPIIYILISLFNLIVELSRVLIRSVISFSSFILQIINHCIQSVLVFCKNSILLVISGITSIATNTLLTTQKILYHFGRFPYQQLIAPVLFLASVSVIASLTFFGLLHIEKQPYPTTLSDFTTQQPIRIFDSNNYVFYEAYSNSSDSFISPSSIPSSLSKTIVALEDPTFYTHHGVTVSSVWEYLKQIFLLIPLEENYSITQRLAKNALETSDSSSTDMIRELILTFQLEKRYSKEELLAMYLSIKPIGLEVGAENASARLFNKPLSQLTDQESLLLASISQTDLLQIYDIDATIQEKYKHTLKTLSKQQTFTDSFLEMSTAVPPYSPVLKTADSNAAQLVLNEVRQQLPKNFRIENGLQIYSTINLSYQTEIERVIIENFSQSELIVPHAMVVIADVSSGSILAATGYSSSALELQQLIQTSTTIQQQAKASVLKPIHSVKNVTSPLGSSIELFPRENDTADHQVQAHQSIVSAFANNLSITGTVLDSQTKQISVDDSEDIITAVADHLLKFNTTTNK